MLRTFFMALACVYSIASFSANRCDVKFSKVTACVNVDWIYGPFLEQYCSAKMSYSENGQIASVGVIPWMVMEHDEHSSRPPVLSKTSDREYLLEKLYFMGHMKGEWYLKIQLKDKLNSIIDEARYHVQFKNQ
jgi:hypothetical protein